MTEIRKKIEIAVDRLDRAIKEHNPVAVIALFSGGHDSFSASYVASLHPSVTRFVHINTGIGVEATRDYVRQTCSTRNWNLLEMKAKENTNGKGQFDPQIYEEIVLKWGFPGPGFHRRMYNRLKERCLRCVERIYGASARGKNKKRILFVSGCRSQESTRRMGNVDEVQIEGRRIWCAPIHDWSKSDTSDCLEIAKQPRNLVVDLIHKSGECLCGAFANPGELEELNQWNITRPVYNEIKRLESLVIPIHGYGWEEKPVKKKCTRQQDLPGMLCWSCKNG